MAAVAWLSLVGCEAEQQTETPAEPLPKLGDIQPAPVSTAHWRRSNSNDAGLPGLPNPTATPPGGTGYTDTPMTMKRMLIERLLFKRDDQRVDFALKLLDTPPFDDESLQLWRANGMAWGRCERDKLPMLMSNLPRPVAKAQYQATAGHAPVPIALSGRLINSQRVRYYEQPGQSRLVKLIGGRYQMLMQLIEPMDPDDPIRLRLLPHHFGPKASLMPRQPAEKMLDGTTFDALALNAKAPDETIWVLWWDGGVNEQETDETNADEPATPTDRTARQARTARSVRSVRQVRAADTGIPLGQALLTGSRNQQPVQVVLLLTVR